MQVTLASGFFTAHLLFLNHECVPLRPPGRAVHGAIFWFGHAIQLACTASLCRLDQLSTSDNHMIYDFMLNCLRTQLKRI